VFDLNIGAFIAPIQPAGGPPPNAGWRGLSLTPDASQLAIADFGAQSVYLFDPDTGAGAATFVGGVAGFANSGPARVAATSTQSIFVGLSVEGGPTSGCASCLSQMNVSVSPPVVQTAPEPEISGLLGAPLLQGNAAGDHVVLAFGNNSAAQIAVWDAASPDQFKISSADATVNDIAATADGAMFSLQTGGGIEVRDAGMFITSAPVSAELTKIPGRNAVPGLAMHPSGALLYQPFLTGTGGAAGVRGGVDISDVRSGELRLRIYLPQQFMTDVDALHGEFLAIDESGQRFFPITSLDGTPQNASLTVVKLAAVPLAIGRVSPSIVAASGRATITIRGSGFQAGITTTIGGKSAAVQLQT
jgi:IPT/TIG domain